MDGRHFLLLSLVAFATSILARAIGCGGIHCDKGPLGLGRPSFGLKSGSKSRVTQTVVHMVTLSDMVNLQFYSDSKYFVAIIIRCRKYF